MFETAGVLAIVELHTSIVWLVALSALWAISAAALALLGHRSSVDDRPSRARAVDAVATPLSLAFAASLFVFAVVSAARLAALGPRRVFLDHVGVIARAGQLDASFDLVLDARAAILCVVIAAVGLAATIAASRRANASSRLPWIAALSASVMVAVLADGWLVIVTGLGASTLVLARLAAHRSPVVRALGFVGDAWVLLGAVVLFWGLDGRFGKTGFVSDLEPRLALVSVSDAPARAEKATLTVASYAGALVTVDSGEPPPGSEPWRAPFTVAVEPGVYSFRIHPGPAAADRLVTHVALSAGRTYVLAPFGPTTSLRTLGDELAIPRPTLAGMRSIRAELGQRTLAGLGLSTLVLWLVVLGVLFRLVLVAAATRPTNVAAPIAALPTLDLVTRAAPILELGGSSRICLAIACVVASLFFAAAAALAASPARAVGHAVAGAVAVAASAILWGHLTAGFVAALAAVLVGVAVLASPRRSVSLRARAPAWTPIARGLLVVARSVGDACARVLAFLARSVAATDRELIGGLTRAIERATARIVSDIARVAPGPVGVLGSDTAAESLLFAAAIGLSGVVLLSWALG